MVLIVPASILTAVQLSSRTTYYIEKCARNDCPTAPPTAHSFQSQRCTSTYYFNLFTYEEMHVIE